ncbi:hypothetical protein [Actinokineospora bangkokensis]|uniref:Uncharacterized protein n=1 Tax=Actinokineospora bangkokensis TaxID=1193682 RepID=A0A1Q9LTZ2_9PSEU|nr:hypothetical protein BJP25_06795 [Actinokineospora bangkokensis]
MNELPHATEYTGRRVRWCGDRVEGLTAAYVDEIAHGGTRPPGPADRCTLEPGALGTVGDLVDVGDIGHVYTLHFDSGYRLDTPLPGDLAAFVDGNTPAGPTVAGGGYGLPRPPRRGVRSALARLRRRFLPT